MEKNEIKKQLYKEKPEAKLIMIRKGVAYYGAKIRPNLTYMASFQVPVEDMGDADFLPVMDAKLLIRWLVE
jgi:hypothetical protein